MRLLRLGHILCLLGGWRAVKLYISLDIPAALVYVLLVLSLEDTSPLSSISPYFVVESQHEPSRPTTEAGSESVSRCIWAPVRLSVIHWSVCRGVQHQCVHWPVYPGFHQRNHSSYVSVSVWGSNDGTCPPWSESYLKSHSVNQLSEILNLGRPPPT